MIFLIELRAQRRQKEKKLPEREFPESCAAPSFGPLLLPQEYFLSLMRCFINSRIRKAPFAGLVCILWDSFSVEICGRTHHTAMKDCQGN